MRGRLADFVALRRSSRCRRCCLLLPQFLGVLQQAEIIAGHAFVTHEGKKRALFDAVVQHTRHLNDFPIQYVLIVLAGVGGLILLVQADLVAARRCGCCWSCAIVHSSAPFGGPLGALTGKFSDLFYSDPRRLSAVVTMLLAPMAGIAALRSRQRRRAAGLTSAPALDTGVTAAVLVVVTVVIGVCYLLPRHVSCSARSTTR